MKVEYQAAFKVIPDEGVDTTATRTIGPGFVNIGRVGFNSRTNPGKIIRGYCGTEVTIDMGEDYHQGCIHVAIDDANFKQALRIVKKVLHINKLTYDAYLEKSSAKGNYRYRKQPKNGSAILIFFHPNHFNRAKVLKIARKIESHFRSQPLNCAYPLAPSFMRVTERTSVLMRGKDPKLKGEYSRHLGSHPPESALS